MLDDNVPKPWRGQTTLVLALSATAVGLGNLFRFPFLLGEHGGAPFFIAYLMTLVLVSVPVLAAEVMLGSAGRSSPIASVRWNADQSGLSPQWQWLGFAQAVLALLLAAQLLVITAWMAEWAMALQTGDLASASASDMAQFFLEMTDNADRQHDLMLGFLLVAAVMAAVNPQYALGVLGWLILPSVAVALLGLLDFSLSRGDLIHAQEYLFARDGDELGWDGAMAGMTSAVFTLGAGLGIGLSFGARTPKNMPLLRSVMAVAIIDTVLLLATAVVIVPLLYAANTQPTQGLALVFVALPYAFANLAMGEVYGALFFGAMATAAFSAIVALIEPAAMTIRREWGWARLPAAALVAMTVLALAAIITSGPLWLSQGWAGFVDGALPLLMLSIAFMVGWRMPRPLARGELFREPRWLFLTWWELVRLVAPTLLILTVLWLWFTV